MVTGGGVPTDQPQRFSVPGVLRYVEGNMVSEWGVGLPFRRYYVIDFEALNQWSPFFTKSLRMASTFRSQAHCFESEWLRNIKDFNMYFEVRSLPVSNPLERHLACALKI